MPQYKVDDHNFAKAAAPWYDVLMEARDVGMSLANRMLSFRSNQKGCGCQRCRCKAIRKLSLIVELALRHLPMNLRMKRLKT